MKLLIDYLSHYEVWVGLILPSLFSLYALKQSGVEKIHYGYYLIFLLSLPISIWLSSWILQSNQSRLMIGLNIYPMFIIFICLFNILTGCKISKYKVYMLSFLNLLIIDIFCAFFPSLVKNTNIFNLFDFSPPPYKNAVYFMTEVYLNLPERLM